MPKHHGHKYGDPDKGPKMIEGAHHFDKGYESDDEYVHPKGYPGDKYRGNRYMEHQNEIVHADSKKLNREKFTKIA